MVDFSGKRILVTGASSGIGRACAQRLAAQGAQIVALGRNEAAVREALPTAQVYVLDLTDEAALKTVVSKIKSEGSLNGCVMAAGVHSLRPLIMEAFENIAIPWRLNFQSVFGLLALLLKGRVVAKGASLVLFSSASAEVGTAGAVSYSASKGAIESATRALAVELAQQGVRVNAVSPGVVRTPMSESLLDKLSAEQQAALQQRHLLGFGAPEDVAGPVSFLLSDDARWITGTVLPVDGGFAIA